MVVVRRELRIDKQVERFLIVFSTYELGTM